MASEARELWFARMMESGLEEKIFEPADVLVHATPEILANHLPPDLMSKVIQVSLAAGAMTPDRVIETVSPALMAKHLPHEVLWTCITNAAKRVGLTDEPGQPAEPPTQVDSDK
jgi:hypothetical protein